MQTKDARWALLSREIIRTRDGRDVLIDRFRIVKSPWFSVYLHDLATPDSGAPHDHPFTFWSLVLRGSYTERITPIREAYGMRYALHERYSYLHRRTWTSWHKMPLHHAHLIVDVEPRTKTVVFAGRRRQCWGFWTEDGFVNWQQYVG